jgi:hypothetical protein
MNARCVLISRHGSKADSRSGPVEPSRGSRLVQTAAGGRSRCATGRCERGLSVPCVSFAAGTAGEARAATRVPPGSRRAPQALRRQVVAPLPGSSYGRLRPARTPRSRGVGEVRAAPHRPPLTPPMRWRRKPAGDCLRSARARRRTGRPPGAGRNGSERQAVGADMRIGPAGHTGVCRHRSSVRPPPLCATAAAMAQRRTAGIGGGSDGVDDADGGSTSAGTGSGPCRAGAPANAPLTLGERAGGATGREEPAES